MDKILNDLKNEYNSINCSEKNLLKGIENVMKKGKRKEEYSPWGLLPLRLRL